MNTMAKTMKIPNPSRLEMKIIEGTLIVLSKVTIGLMICLERRRTKINERYGEVWF